MLREWKFYRQKSIFHATYGGMQPTGGYRIEAKENRDTSGIGSIDAYFFKPDLADMVTEVITYPCYITGIKPGEKVHVKLMNSDGTVVIMEKTIE